MVDTHNLWVTTFDYRLSPNNGSPTQTDCGYAQTDWGMLLLYPNIRNSSSTLNMVFVLQFWHVMLQWVEIIDETINFESHQQGLRENKISPQNKCD